MRTDRDRDFSPTHMEDPAGQELLCRTRPISAVNSRMEPSVLSSPRPFSSCRSNMCVHAPLLIGNSIFNKCTQIDFQLGAFKRSYETQSQARTHTHHMFLPPTPHSHTPVLSVKLFNLPSVVFRASNILCCQKYLLRDFWF